MIKRFDGKIKTCSTLDERGYKEHWVLTDGTIEVVKAYWKLMALEVQRLSSLFYMLLNAIFKVKQ